METGNLKKALTDINKATTITPCNAGVFNTRGKIKALQKNDTGAIDDFSYAIKLNPDDNKVYFDRGMSQLRLKNMDKACHDLTKARDMGNKDASEAILKYCQ